MAQARILLADDHGVVRKGLRYLLEREGIWEVAGEAGDGREAVRLATELQPDVVVMDIAMPGLNGIDAAAQVLKAAPKSRVLILSMHADESYLLRSLNAGVRGYLLKDSAEEDLVRAVKAVLEGQSFFSPRMAQMLADEYTRTMQKKGMDDSYELLSAREREVLQLLAAGKSNKEAGEILSVSVYTIETHRTHIMQKLNLHNTAELVLYAVRKKIIV
jgi:two-component system, NarL family, response regulator NreC